MLSKSSKNMKDKNTGLDTRERDVAMYNTFKNEVYTPVSVLYPSCGIDVSPAEVFDNVTFVDIEMSGSKGCIDKLKEFGYNAVKSDINNYVPSENHDLLILNNPAIDPEKATKHLDSGSYILANDYHNSASHLDKYPQKYELLGIINVKNKGDLFEGAFSKNLEDLFEEVDDLKELKELRPDYYTFLEGEVKMLAQNMSPLDKNKSFEELWEDSRKLTNRRMPYKRVANRYVFLKK